MYFLVISTSPSIKEARRIAKAVLKEHLAACINIQSPIESHYLWKGKPETVREVLMLIKTRKVLLGKLQKRIEKLHSYQIPEIIAIPIRYGSKKYFTWINRETRK